MAVSPIRFLLIVALQICQWALFPRYLGKKRINTFRSGKGWPKIAVLDYC
jgi:hypothetical protein